MSRDGQLSRRHAPDNSMDRAYTKALELVRAALENDSYWRKHPGLFTVRENTSPAIHLAIFVEPYLRLILEGQKTVESRFASRRFAPYEQAAEGDVILLKRSGGPVVGICTVAEAWFYRLDHSSWELITKRFAKAICPAGPEFWEERRNAAYASLLRVEHVRHLEPIPFPKRDRRGWAVVTPRISPAPLTTIWEDQHERSHSSVRWPHQ
jgi:hypothetical protein